MLDNYIETIPAQQRTREGLVPGLGRRGLPDACTSSPTRIPSHVCIFGGDNVYKMDVRQMLAEHIANDADVTVAAIPVRRAEARQFGVIESDAEGRIKDFHEKSENPRRCPIARTCASRRWAITSSRPAP